ncbi:hypothetical protein NG798_09045 [Ancylothrix sp. C2]|uniref:hypothetical protein n=1 Tax=Ancylothrix sp. D3o TaxID=2953691 RepID=UPI0021BAF981|nr:hypothetical protein [Ancylothrix sp. D3o]MCT7949930.1 hypothetical protein [Ancylothrix sp. D3o]
MLKNRVLICSLIALSSGFFCSYLGGQLSVSARTNQCQNKNLWGLEKICSTVMTAPAWFQGSSTGIWVGTILGAFIAGSVTRSGKTL